LPAAGRQNSALLSKDDGSKVYFKGLDWSVQLFTYVAKSSSSSNSSWFWDFRAA
jgi:hypothetical protein